MKELMLALLLAVPVAAQDVAVPAPEAAASPSETPAQAAEVKHTVVKGDHLWGLSKHYYNNPYKWRAIHNANPFIKDPHWIYPGQVLTIPGAEVAAATPDEPFPPASSLSKEEVKGITVTQAPKPVEKPAPPPVVQQEGLSVEMPEQMSGGYPSMARVKAPKGWKKDGEITGFDGRETMVAQGDFIMGTVGGAPLKRGETLYVLRKDAVEDTDADKKADYYVRVGMLEVKRKVSGNMLIGVTYKMLIIQSGDSMQKGDLISRRPL